ncbi:MAG: hypothetical protein R3C49_22850 [Planctomycetaceae bacterium]
MERFLNQAVVVDLEAPFVHVGTLSELNEHSLVLTDADVHDLRDSNTTRERYVLDSKLHGVRTNRRLVLIPRHQVVSISLLDDVIH